MSDVINPYFFPPFSPDEITGLVLWYDFNDSSTITESSGIISSVSDKSGNGNGCSQPTSSFRPTVATASVNGKNTALFDGANDFLIVTNNAIYDDPFTIFFVCQQVSGGNANQDVFTRSQAAASGGKRIVYVSNLMRTQVFGASNSSATLITLSPVTDLIINVFKFNTGAVHDHAVDLVEDSVTAATGVVNLNAQFCVGSASGGANNNFKGHICEAMIYNSLLSDSDTNQVKTYLNKKWNSY